MSDLEPLGCSVSVKRMHCLSIVFFPAQSAHLKKIMADFKGGDSSFGGAKTNSFSWAHDCTT